MKKKLPISWPITETYQSSSFVMGVICAHDNIKYAYENNYINLSCFDTNCIKDMGLTFWNVTWDDFRKSGVFEMNLYHIDNFSRDSLADFWKERIDQGNYLLLHKVDEYYLPYAEFYHNTHLVHDTYIHGYEKKFFDVIAYSRGKLKKLKVSSVEIIQSIFSTKEFETEVFFCSLRPNPAIRVAIDYQKIRRGFYEYLRQNASHIEDIKQNENVFYNFFEHAESEEGRVYGNAVYDVLINCLLNIIFSNTDLLQPQIDIRPFRLIWEHKRIILERVKLILTQYDLPSDILSSFEKLVSLSHRIFMLAIKFSVTTQSKILERMIAYIKELKNMEEFLLSEFIALWETSTSV